MSGYVTKSRRIVQLQILADERATERDEAVGHLNHCRGLLETAEAQRDEANLKAIQRADALEAAEADRDRLQAKLTDESGYCGEVLIERDRYREALEQIVADGGSGGWHIAREALATPDTPPDAEVCQFCGTDILEREGRWCAVESRYPNEAHCHYHATTGKSVGHAPDTPPDA